MVTAEPNNADGWNIRLINDGKHFLKIHPFPWERRNECVILLISPCLLRAFANWCSEGPWGQGEEGDIVEISIFSPQTQNRKDSWCLLDLLKITPHKEHFFVRVIVHTGFLLWCTTVLMLVAIKPDDFIANAWLWPAEGPSLKSFLTTASLWDRARQQERALC